MRRGRALKEPNGSPPCFLNRDFVNLRLVLVLTESPVLLLPPKTLLLAVGFPRCDPEDFKDIAQRIGKIAPEIKTHVFHPYRFSELLPTVWEHPTLLVNLTLSEPLKMPRGATLLSRPLSKLQQFEMFRIAGIRTPLTAKYETGMAIDRKVWGEFILMKPMPLHLTSKKMGIQVFRTSRLSGMTASYFAADHLVHSTEMLIQQFVDTGPHLEKYRALTLCGEVLYIARSTNEQERPELSSPDDVIEAGNFRSDGSHVAYGHYPEVHEFARRLVAAFPAVPLLGCDIVRDVGSGELHALEVNAGGNVWHFSSQLQAERRARLPEDMKRRQEQYGAFDVAAKALVRATRRMAM